MKNDDDSDPPRLPPGFAEQFAHAVAPALAAWQRQLNDVLLPTMQGIQAAAQEALRAYEPQFQQILTTLGPILERIRDALPPNWPKESGAAAGVLELAKTDQLPTAWVPSADILLQLIAASDFDQRLAILGERRVEIVADCLRVLGEIRGEELQSFVTATTEAAETLAAGHLRASQALSAAVLSGLVTDRVAATLSAARKALQSLDVESAVLAELSTVLALIPVRSALSQFDQGGPHPDKFNRHAAAHNVDPVQYTAGNACLGLLTVVSFLRQESQLISEGDTSLSSE